MARYQESKAVCAHGPTDSTGCLGSTYRMGQLSVGHGDRLGTTAQIFPDRELERRPDCEHRNRGRVGKGSCDHFLNLRRVAQGHLGTLGLHFGYPLLPTLHEAKSEQMVACSQSDAVAEWRGGDAVEQFSLRAEGADPGIMW